MAKDNLTQTHIRVYKKDKDLVNEMAKSLKMKVPRFINEIITSPKIQLQERVKMRELEELKKREEDLKKRIWGNVKK